MWICRIVVVAAVDIKMEKEEKSWMASFFGDLKAQKERKIIHNVDVYHSSLSQFYNHFVGI